MVTIIDLKSGGPKWNIDVGLEIGCVGTAGGTVLVVGKDSIVTWNLLSGDRTFNAASTTSFGPPFSIILHRRLAI